MMFREPKESKKIEREELDTGLCLMHLKEIAVKQQNIKMLKDCLTDFKKNNKELNQIDDLKSSILCHTLRSMREVKSRHELDLMIEIIKLLAKNGAKLGEQEIDAAKKLDNVLQGKAELKFTSVDSLTELLMTIQAPLPTKKM